MYNPPTAPLSIGGVLDDGFRLLKASFTKVFPIALLYSIVGIVPSLLIQTPNPEAVPEISGGFGVALVVAWILGIVFFTALVAGVDAVAKRSSISISAALGIGVRRLFPLLGCFLLLGLAIMGGSLLLVVPGLILMISLSMAPYLLITEGMGPLEALKASHHLVWGNWWRTATILTVVLFIIIVASFLAGLLSGTGAAFGMISEGAGGVISSALAVLINALIMPLYYAFGIALLRDLQLRKLGGDLDQRIGAIEAA